MALALTLTYVTSRLITSCWISLCLLSSGLSCLRGGNLYSPLKYYTHLKVAALTTDSMARRQGEPLSFALASVNDKAVFTRGGHFKVS
jgi:hypothetical protein